MARRTEVLIFVIALLCILSLMLNANYNTTTWWDEYIFIQLAKNFPDYSTSASWLWTAPETVRYVDIGYEYYEIIYNAPVYLHMPLAPMLVSPLVKLTENIQILRFFTILLSLGSICLVYLILRRRIGWYAILGVFPIFLCSVLLNGAMWFYWDAFMTFFFLLTMYIMEVKPQSKWKYVTACCLVWTKMYIGVAFLLPLVIKNWKMIFCAFSIIPFYIYTIVVTGDWFYIISHYWEQSGIWRMVYKKYVLPDIWAIVRAWSLPPYVVMTGGIIFLVKKYPSIVVFYLMALAYGCGFGFGLYHGAIMLYSGAFAFPLVCHYLVKRQQAKQLVKVEV